MEINRIYWGDSFELDKEIPDKSVDMILEDMPYGTTACKWDQRVDLEKYWESRKRIIKDNGAIVLTASQPFTSMLVMSNLEMFKYEWIWDKKRGVGHLNAKKRPLIQTESVCIFYNKQSMYNPQMRSREKARISKNNATQKVYGKSNDNFIGETLSEKFPVNLIRFSKSDGKDMLLHPTQKPVALFEYLIKTYTNEGDLVFDGFSGSGTTAVACLNTSRNFICIEKEQEYFDKSMERLEQQQQQFKLAV